MKKQTLVSAGKCLGPKPPQPELQQQCELANVSLIKETQVCIYWEAVNTTGLFMSIERRTLKYSNLSARTGTIAATVHSRWTKKSAFLVDDHYLILNQCM